MGGCIVADAGGGRNRMDVPGHGGGGGEHAPVIQPGKGITASNRIRTFSDCLADKCLIEGRGL
jgi:hypothetical protein